MLFVPITALANFMSTKFSSLVHLAELSNAIESGPDFSLIPASLPAIKFMASSHGVFLKAPFFLYKRIPEPFGMLYEFKSIPAFNTKRAFVNRVMLHRGNAGYAVFFNMQIKTTAAAAVGANRGNLFH